jgi:hypothetical protein
VPVTFTQRNEPSHGGQIEKHRRCNRQADRPFSPPSDTLNSSVNALNPQEKEMEAYPLLDHLDQKCRTPPQCLIQAVWHART